MLFFCVFQDYSSREDRLLSRACILEWRVKQQKSIPRADVSTEPSSDDSPLVAQLKAQLQRAEREMKDANADMGSTIDNLRSQNKALQDQVDQCTEAAKNTEIGLLEENLELRNAQEAFLLGDQISQAIEQQSKAAENSSQPSVPKECDTDGGVDDAQQQLWKPYTRDDQSPDIEAKAETLRHKSPDERAQTLESLQLSRGEAAKVLEVLMVHLDHELAASRQQAAADLVAIKAKDLELNDLRASERLLESQNKRLELKIKESNAEVLQVQERLLKQKQAPKDETKRKKAEDSAMSQYLLSLSHVSIVEAQDKAALTPDPQGSDLKQAELVAEQAEKQYMSDKESLKASEGYTHTHTHHSLPVV